MEALEEEQQRGENLMKYVGTHILKIHLTSAILHILSENICKRRGTDDISHFTKLL